MKSQFNLLKNVLLVCVAFSATARAAQEDSYQGITINQSTDAAFAEVTRQLGINGGKDAFGAYLLTIGISTRQNICVIAENKEDKAASDEYAKLGEKLIPHDLLHEYASRRARFDSKAIFKKVFKDFNEAAEYLTDKEQIDWQSINRPREVVCNVLIATIADMAKLTGRAEGSSQLKAMTGIGIVLERMALLNSMAIREGYNDYMDYSFWGRSALLKHRAFLIAQGIVDESTLQTAYSEMKGDSYDDGADAEMLVQYLTDRTNAKLNKVSVLAQRNSRLAEEKRVAERKAAEEKKRLAEYAKDYPYRAVFSCRLPSGNNYILACFSGYSRAIGSSEIRLTTGGTSKIIGPLDMVGSSQDLRDGFEIDLPKHFSLYAQNVAEYQKLGLKIYQRPSGKEIYSNEVSQFGVIRIAK